MTHSMYQSPSSGSLLSQGDIIISDLLRDYLRGHQDYIANKSEFYRYMVLTQTCDLGTTREISDFIFITVIRKLSETLSIRHVENSRARDSTEKLMKDLLNHNYNKRGFFYLPKDINQGIEVESVVDLRVGRSRYRGEKNIAHYSLTSSSK